MFNRHCVDTAFAKQPSLSDGLGAEFILSVTKLKDERLVCVHEVQNGKIGAAKPIDKSALSSMIHNLCSDVPVDHWKSSKVLYQSPTALVWYRDASTKPEDLWFRQNNKVTHIKAKLPTLVFVEHKTQLYIFAASSNKVARSTPLYHAPLCNINEKGSLCFGTADAPDRKDTLAVRMKKHEDAVLTTNFSHINCKKTFKVLSRKNHDTNEHIEQWQVFEASGLRPKASDLVKCNATLEDVIKRLER
ncbi:hypothetical protein [Rheinheimera sp.]|uniref:hypothetical protein n=1 Tax=Rheinheimera sp. TaxID=1869214 RepID=UPI0040481EDB